MRTRRPATTFRAVTTSSTPYTVRAIAEADRARWRELYGGYLDFYKTRITEDQLEEGWSWLCDDAHKVRGLVADGPRGVIGLAHYPEFSRPSSASRGGFLDDLFVDPAARGTGASEALLSMLRAIGAQRGWTVIRWITANDNYRARAKYDYEAQRTSWIMYDMSPST